MNRPADERLLAFLEGDLADDELARLLEDLERDPDLARDLRSAARGLSAVQWLARDTAPALRAGPASGRRISPWWAVAAAAAALLVAIPTTLVLSRNVPAADRAAFPVTAPADGPGFLLVLYGRWPDAANVEADESRRRAAEYWAWADSLADMAVLRAAGDLRWEPGRRLGPDGATVAVTADVVESPDFMVGMFALNVASYEEAMAIARNCPHLRYGGSVSVRQVARRFFTPIGSADPALLSPQGSPEL